MQDISHIRNFCIIAHIDHGKSTLADRFLELTKTIPKREMRDQVLDQMDIERERGITIKLQPVTMNYKGYELNLIDTPGHVDFSYEVSRSLAACEGALLLVDATQGIEAQTLANLYLALEQNLAIIPIINKIDLKNADIERVTEDLINLLGCQKEQIILVSAKTGQNVEQILDRIINDIPQPKASPNALLKALIFDSKFDEYRGIIAFVRIFEGTVKVGDKIAFFSTKKETEVLEVGNFKPKLVAKDEISAGEIGYIATGLKEANFVRVGDTINLSSDLNRRALPGYKTLKPMVFAGIFCQEGDDFPELREGIEKLKLNDASLAYEPENSQGLGFGFRGGFLGLLHLEVFIERLKREYNLDLVVTSPSVAFKIIDKKNNERIIRSPQELPEKNEILKVEEPWMKVDIITPSEYLGNIMGLVNENRGKYLNTEYLDKKRVILHYEIPLSFILVNFYDKLKSVSSGHASLNYEFLEYRQTAVDKLEIHVARKPVDSLSQIVYQDQAYHEARRIVDSLKGLLPKKQFEVRIQGLIGGKIIASASIPPLRKDVTAKLYGGDFTRKRKLLEKQKKGKKKMKKFGEAGIPPEVYLAILRR